MWLLLSSFFSKRLYIMYTVAGLLALSGAIFTGFYIAKKYKESHYKKEVRKNKEKFTDCVKKAKNHGALQLCYLELSSQD